MNSSPIPFDRLVLVYGTDAFRMAYSIMTAARINEIICKDATIALKPNLVVAKPSHSGATTSPLLTAGIIEYLKDNGFNKILIAESSWIGDSTERAFDVCGYRELSKKYNVPLIDLKKDSTVSLSFEGQEIKICRSVLEVDVLINLPVLKAHCQTLLTCALKNLKGCIPDSEKRRFHTLGLHRPIALLNKLLKSHLTVVDGLMGDLDFEEGGNPVSMNRVILGPDPVLIDTYAASLLGYAANKIPYIGMAEKLGVGSAQISDTTIVELNKDQAPQLKHATGRKIAHLSKYISEDQACSACYGSLIHALNRLDGERLLHKFKGQIHIGQGYKDKHTGEMGVGDCTFRCAKNVPGCPPGALEIASFIRKNL